MQSTCKRILIMVLFTVALIPVLTAVSTVGQDTGNATIISEVETPRQTLIKDTSIVLALFLIAILAPLFTKRLAYGLRGIVFYSILLGLSVIAMAYRASIPLYLAVYDVNGTMQVETIYGANPYLKLYYIPIMTALAMLIITGTEALADYLEKNLGTAWGRRRRR